MVLSCINTLEVILSDWRDTGAGPSKNTKNLMVLLLFIYRTNYFTTVA